MERPSYRAGIGVGERLRGNPAAALGGLGEPQLLPEEVSSTTLSLFAGVHWGELPEHRLLLPEGGEGGAPEPADRHLRLWQWQQPAGAQGCVPDQDLL